MMDKALKLSPDMLVDTLSKVTDAAKEYSIVREQEVTKRADIAARRDVALAQIQGHRDVLLYALERVFKERAAVLTKQFEVLDGGLASGDAVRVQAALDSIVDVLQSSPFPPMAELRAIFTTPGRTLEL